MGSGWKLQLMAKANDQRPRTNDDPRRYINLASYKCSLWQRPTTNGQGPTTIPALYKTRVLQMQFMAKANDQRPRTTDDRRHHDSRCDHRSERGYILLMLMLFITLLAIAAGTLAPSIAFRVRRDREEEMIHRGTQYSRALRRFVKKTGRYPTRLEELENTNNIRFLRKRYKDPITGKDFKLLHVGEVQLTSAPVIAGAAAVGGNAAAVAGGAAALLGAAGASGMLGGAAAQTSPLNAASPTANTGTDAAGGSGPNAGAANAGPGNDQSKSDSNQPGGATGSNQLSSTVFGGGPIVGVASTSKEKSIREFNHKSHYNEWQFIYDPSMDRGGLITTPAQPPLQVTAPVQQQNSSSPGNPAGSQTPFGGMQSPPPAQPTQTPQQ
jgi:type II secretory pathway pseudopilin PulG